MAQLQLRRTDDPTEEHKTTYEINKGVIFRICAPFIECKSGINNTKINHAKDLDIVMAMYNLIECNNNYLKISGSFWQYYIDQPGLNNDANIVNLLGNSTSFKLKVKFIGISLLTVIGKMLK